MKLSIAGNPDNIKTVWAGQGLLAFVSGDDLVRFYYLETDQSYFLTLSDHELGKNYVEDNFSCIDYNSRKRILVVGMKFFPKIRFYTRKSSYVEMQCNIFYNS